MIVGSGIDIVKIYRIKNSIDKYGSHFLNKIFTELEIQYCLKKANPYPSYAARFAVKEAAFKALGTGINKGVTWKQSEVSNDELGKPILTLTGKALEISKKLGATEFFVSISHTDEDAIAQVILQKN